MTTEIETYLVDLWKLRISTLLVTGKQEIPKHLVQVAQLYLVLFRRFEVDKHGTSD